METHLDNVGPILKKHSLRGTFFVTTGVAAWRKRLAEWQRLAAEGHEIGGHTVNHPCLLERIEPHAQDYTPQMMEAEVRDSAQTILREIPGQHGLTFAYPCGNMSFGPPVDQTRNAALYQRYISEHFFAARSYGWAGTVVPDELSVLSVPDLGFTAGHDFRGLLAMADPALRNHRWGVFTFHGVGGQWLSVTTEALDELASYLARHPEIWTAAFGDVVRYIQESKALGIHQAESTDHQIQFELTWPLDAQTFYLPLTLQWQLPGGWTSCSASAEGKPLAVKGSSGAVLFDVPAQTRSLRIEKK
ncbi:MAG: polysaccharide deacetylase family protein [Acidobacteriia bacterium]|nr:polysaccharide deacetylase family protein [Terriglobia bacterium]